MTLNTHYLDLGEQSKDIYVTIQQNMDMETRHAIIENITKVRTDGNIYLIIEQNNGTSYLQLLA